MAYAEKYSIWFRNVLVKFDSNELIYSFFNERQEEEIILFDSLHGIWSGRLYSVEEMIEKGEKQFLIRVKYQKVDVSLDPGICDSTKR